MLTYDFNSNAPETVITEVKMDNGITVVQLEATPELIEFLSSQHPAIILT